MNEFLWQFSTREIAVIVWLIIAALLLLPRAHISYGDLAKNIFNPKILIPYASLLAYLLLIIYGLSRIDYWKFDLLKDTLFWSFSAVVVMMYRTSKADSFKTFIRTSLKDTLTIAVVLEFILNFYTFNIFVELILVPFITIVVLLNTIAQNSSSIPNVEPAKKLFNWLLFIAGFILLIIAAVKFVDNPSSLLTIDSLRSFTLPIVLSLALLPALYAFSLLCMYELAFLVLNNYLDKQINGKRIKVHIIKICKVRLQKISNIRHYFAVNYEAFSNEEEIHSLIDDYKGNELAQS